MSFNKSKLLPFLSSILLLTSVQFFSGCAKEDQENETIFDVNKEFNFTDMAYGDHPHQKMDIYLPANRDNDSTKVFVLIHGGGWSAGDKADFKSLYDGLKNTYPNHAIINLNYRLATSTTAAYPMQIDDIQSALDHIQLPEYSVSKQYFLMGASAGGHLSMLYGYAFDPNHYVKGICNTVGPSDITDPAYINNPLFAGPLKILTGGVSYAQNPALYAEISPAKRVTPASPKTISFYGSLDPLVPVSQMALLQKALDENGVYSEATMYQGDGHGNWSPANAQDCLVKIINFINLHFK